MVSKTGKTQVAKNSIGIYGNMNKYNSWQKSPYIKHAVQFLLLGQTVVGCSGLGSCSPIIFQS